MLLITVRPSELIWEMWVDKLGALADRLTALQASQAARIDVDTLEAWCERVSGGLDTMTDTERQQLAGCGKTLLSAQDRKLSDDKRRPIACSERINRIGLSHAECRRDS